MTFTNDQARPYQAGSLFLGLDENGREIGISTDRHAITIAGSRAGKGAALIIPNLLRWPDNVLVIDPKGENAEQTYQRREEMGQAVHVLDPFGSANVPDRIRAGFNPLASIDLTSNRARATVSAIANGLIVVTDPKHMEWVSGARALLSGVISYVLVNAPAEHHNFATVRNILMQPTELPDEDGEAQGLWADAQEMAQDTRMGGLIRSAGLTIITAIESSKGMEKDFLGLARRSTEWLDDEAIAACLNHSTFQLSDLKTGAASVYLVLPADGDFLETYGAFLRLFVKTALNAMGVEQQGRRCLFILDEFYSLGKLEEIVDAAGRMPSYGVHLWPFLQNLTQLYERYGRDGAETFFGNADAHVFFGNTDGTTLDYISNRMGKFTPNEVVQAPPIKRAYDTWSDARLFESEQDSRARVEAEDATRVRQYQHRMGLAGTPRLPPDIIKAMVAKMDNNKVAKSMIVFGKGNHVFNLGLAPYFQPHTPPPKVPKSPAHTVDNASLNSQASQNFADLYLLFCLWFLIPFFAVLFRKITAQWLVDIGFNGFIWSNFYWATALTSLAFIAVCWLASVIFISYVEPQFNDEQAAKRAEKVLYVYLGMFLVERLLL